MKRSWQKWLGAIVTGYFLVLVVIVCSLYVVARLRGTTASTNLSPNNNFTRFLPLDQNGEDPSTVNLVPAWAPTLGNPNAPLTIVEFGDFQCPFCRESVQPLQQILAEHPNDVRLVFRQLPIVNVHPLAEKLAEAALCAHAQGKFWPMHDKLYQLQDTMTEDTILDVALSVGLDRQQFNQCYSSHQFAGDIQQDLTDAVALGASGTPTWIVNGQKIEGALPLEAWEQIVAGIKH